jgi:hypothetical protein
MRSQTHMFSKLFHLITQLTQHFIVILASNIEYIFFSWSSLHILITYNNVRNIDRLFNNNYLFLSRRVPLTYFFFSFFSAGKVIEFASDTLFFIITPYHITSLSIFIRFLWGESLRFEQFLFNRISFGAGSK